jgi:hypothetical protein
MTRDQARKVKLSGNFLHSYLTTGGNMLAPTDQEILDLIDGNFLLANAVIGMLAPLRRKSFDEALDELPPRDEGFPQHAAATPMWATTVDLLRYARGSGWQQMPQPSLVYDVPTALRSSFNLAVAVTYEFAAQTGQPPANVAKTFADAAALADVGPSEVGSGDREPGRSPQTAAWFG